MTNALLLGGFKAKLQAPGASVIGAEPAGGADEAQTARHPLSEIDGGADNFVFRFDGPETLDAPASAGTAGGDAESGRWIDGESSWTAGSWSGSDGSGWTGGGGGGGWTGGSGGGWTGGGGGGGGWTGGSGGGWTGGGGGGWTGGGGTDGGTGDGGGGIDLDWLLPVEVTIMVDGVERSFGIIMPKDFDASATYSGIMTFHGGGTMGTDPTAMAGLADWSSYENPPQFIEIFPMATQQGWAWDADDTWTDDVAYVEALVDELVANWNLDASALFAAGISAGGSMVQKLALEVPELFAGYGVVVSSLKATMEASAVASATDEPMIFFHGTADTSVPYDGYYDWWGNPILYSAEETVEFFASLNETEMGEFILLPDVADDGMTALMRVSDDGSIQHYVIEGGDHSWPGSLDDSPQDIDASQLMIDFFSEYGLF